MPPEDIDVNIHPTKKEIKMKDEQELCFILKQFCEQTLMQKGSTKESIFPLPPNSIQNTIKPARGSNEIQESLEHIFDNAKTFFTRGNIASPQKAQTAVTENKYYLPSDIKFPGQETTLEKKLAAANYIGQFSNKYLLFESERSLLVVDQHAAAERIGYETIIRQISKNSVEVQRLLSPVLIKLTAQELIAYEELQNILDKFGFENNQWDQETIAIHTHPRIFSDVERAVRNIFSGEVIDKNNIDALARRACRASIKAGDIVNADAANYHKKQLLNCVDPFTCPHGRPIIVEVKEEFLDKQFLRT